jgi:mannose-1-phosphate guanylyltransferase
MSLHAVVLAGGIGSRLWPRSTPEAPKQFQSLLADAPLLALAVERGARFAGDRVWVVTDERYIDTVRQLAPLVEPQRVLAEPCPRGTLGAVMLAAAAVQATDPDAIIVVLPSDHLCHDEERLAGVIQMLAPQLGAGDIGLVATPTGIVNPAFGHVRPGQTLDKSDMGEIAAVDGYIEKPASAAELRDGPWLRNMGIVVGHAPALLGAAPPDVAAAAQRVASGAPDAVGAWEALAADRIEDVVLPRSRALIVACADVEWIDVGTWPALFERADLEPTGNLVDGAVAVAEATGNVIMSTGAPVAVIGVSDALIVVTPEQVLVCDRRHADRVRAILDKPA